VIGKLIALIALLLVSGCGSHVSDSPQWITMGTVAKVSFKHDTALQRFTGVSPLDKRIVNEVQNIYTTVENRLSIWNKDSEISNYTSIENVSSEMRHCYETAFNLQKVSGNAFNPFWRGKGNGPDLGGIAKGFAVDLAAEKVCEHIDKFNIKSSGILLDLGGNLKVVSGEWRTGIRNPYGEMESILLTNGMACATSGEYERGKHIYDGRTGRAVSNNLISVTVVHPFSAMIADGLSTTLFVLGKDDGEIFLKQHYPEAKAYWLIRPSN
jgi:thiamine biosynthesis lipoprotein